MGRAERIGQLRYAGRHHVRRLLKRSTPLYMAVSRLRHRGTQASTEVWDMMEPRTLSSDTRIVIEGPRRSGNTFAVVAFREAQTEPVAIAHHLHAAAHVISALKSGTPSLVLLREPEDVVVSSVVSFPPTTIEHALGDYILFYSRLSRHRDRFVTATFQTVTSDFGSVIDAVNRRHGTDFALFDHTEDNVAHCFGLIEQRYALMAKAERAVARPSEQRKQEKEAVRRRYLEADLARSRARASELYEMFAEGAL